jgi:hypothetical protein
MKLLSSFFSRISAALIVLAFWTVATTIPIRAAPIATCRDQLACLDVSVTSQISNDCGAEYACQYKVCLTLNFDKPDCIKEKSETMAHTCETPENECFPDEYRFRDESNQTAVSNMRHGYDQCHIVPAGGIAEFVFRDGDEDLCGLAYASAGASTLSCRDFGDPTCIDGGQCLWTVAVPEACGQNHGGGDGDPHLRLWNSTRFSYHGECDLVLLQNDNFANGRGMDIHIRTTHEAFYSYIEEAAIRLGDDVVEFAQKGFYVNGVQGMDSDLPTTIGGGFVLKAPTLTPSGATKSYIIELQHGDYLLVYKYKHFLAVQVHGQPQDFGTSVGLLGNFYTSSMLARDGVTVLHDPDEFGAEWQVRQDELQLFRTLREPQHPTASCKPVPETSRKNLRHLRTGDASFVQAAEAACAHKSINDFDFCVHDVLATRDFGMAEAW